MGRPPGQLGMHLNTLRIRQNAWIAVRGGVICVTHTMAAEFRLPRPRDTITLNDRWQVLGETPLVSDKSEDNSIFHKLYPPSLELSESRRREEDCAARQRVRWNQPLLYRPSGRPSGRASIATTQRCGHSPFPPYSFDDHEPSFEPYDNESDDDWF